MPSQGVIAAKKRKVKREKERKNFLSKAFAKHAGTIAKAVDLAESAFGGKRRGKEKHAFVVGIINAAIDIPLLNEATEAHLIGEAIEAAVKLLKKKKPPAE